MRGDDHLRLDLERDGGGDEIRLVGHQEIEHGHQHRWLANPLAQFLGGNAGQREEAFGMIVIRQNPAQRG